MNPPALARRQVLAALLLLAGAPLRAQDFSRVQIESTQLAEHLYLLTGAGGNMALCVGDDTTFLVDDQFAPLAPKIKAAIARLARRPLQFVLNTHYHFDHTGGNEALGSDGAVIVAHDNVRVRLSSDQLLALFNQTQKASPKVALPIVTVPGELKLHVNGETIHAFHAPHAHTDGDLIVHFGKAGVVHMGDLFFNGLYPFIDGAARGSADGVIAAADRVLAIGDDRLRIIPGHGPLAGKAELRAYREMLATVTQRIRELRRAGRTDTEIVAAKPTAEFDARWGGGFLKPEVFVTMMLGVVAK